MEKGGRLEGEGAGALRARMLLLLARLVGRTARRQAGLLQASKWTPVRASVRPFCADPRVQPTKR